MASLPAVSCFVLVNTACPNRGGFTYNLTCLVLYLFQLENYIVENMKSEMAQIQQNAVQNHTATMLEIGTSLLSQTAEQTRKLTDVETQVCPQGQSHILKKKIILEIVFSLLHKQRAYVSMRFGKTYIFCLLVTTTMSAWQAMSALMRGIIFRLTCVCKKRAGKKPNQH